MLITLASLVAIAVVGFFWNAIMGYVVNSFLPYIREYFPPLISGALERLTELLNGAVVTVSKSVYKAYHWLKDNLLRCSTTYTINKEGNAVSETVTIIRENGTFKGMKTTREFDKWDMPAEVLDELTRNARTGVNVKQELLDRTRQMAEKQAIALEIAE